MGRQHMPPGEIGQEVQPAGLWIWFSTSWFSTPGSVPQGLRFFKRCTVINSFTVLLESITDPQPSKSDLPHMSLRSDYMFNMVPFVYLLLVFLFLLFVTFFGVIGSVQFSRLVVSDSLRPHGLQHARLPCPSSTPWACSNSRPWSWWCHSTISSSVVPFSCLQSFSASESFSMSQFFLSGSQSIWCQGIFACYNVMRVSP